MCTSCLSSAENLTEVHCAHRLHIVTQLRCIVHCQCCALCNRTVQSDYTVHHEWSRNKICPKKRGSLHQCAQWRSFYTVEYATCSRCVPVAQSTLQQFIVYMACIQSRNFIAYCTAHFVDYASLYCKDIIERYTNRGQQGNVQAVVH